MSNSEVDNKSAILEDKDLAAKIEDFRQLLMAELRRDSPDVLIAKYASKSEDLEDGDRELALILLALLFTDDGNHEAATVCAKTVMEGDYDEWPLHKATGFLIIAQATGKRTDIELYKSQIHELASAYEQAAAWLDYLALVKDWIPDAAEEIRETQAHVRRLNDDIAAQDDCETSSFLYLRLGLETGLAEDFLKACQHAERILPDPEGTRREAFEQIIKAMVETLDERALLDLILRLSSKSLQDMALAKLQSCSKILC